MLGSCRFLFRLVFNSPCAPITSCALLKSTPISDYPIIKPHLGRQVARSLLLVLTDHAIYTTIPPRLHIKKKRKGPTRTKRYPQIEFFSCHYIHCEQPSSPSVCHSIPIPFRNNALEVYIQNSNPNTKMTNLEIMTKRNIFITTSDPQPTSQQ